MPEPLKNPFKTPESLSRSIYHPSDHENHTWITSPPICPLCSHALHVAVTKKKRVIRGVRCLSCKSYYYYLGPLHEHSPKDTNQSG